MLVSEVLERATEPEEEDATVTFTRIPSPSGNPTPSAELEEEMDGLLAQEELTQRTANRAHCAAVRRFIRNTEQTKTNNDAGERASQITAAAEGTSPSKDEGDLQSHSNSSRMSHNASLEVDRRASHLDPVMFRVAHDVNASNVPFRKLVLGKEQDWAAVWLIR